MPITAGNTLANVSVPQTIRNAQVDLQNDKLVTQLGVDKAHSNTVAGILMAMAKNTEQLVGKL